MSTTLLARLLTEPGLRARWAEDADGVLDAHPEVTTSERDVLLALSGQDLERQAAGLLRKRYREIASILPATSAGQEAAFRAYAVEAAWPAGHHRHLLDAAAFLSALARKHKRVCLLEASAISTRLGGTRARVRVGWVWLEEGWLPALSLSFRGRQWVVRLPFPGMPRRDDGSA